MTRGRTIWLGTHVTSNVLLLGEDSLVAVQLRVESRDVVLDLLLIGLTAEHPTGQDRVSICGHG